jgi:hypothetical protein
MKPATPPSCWMNCNCFAYLASMDPKAFLPSNTPWSDAASVVPPTPTNAGPVAGGRRSAPKAPSLAQRIQAIDRFLYDNRDAPREQRLALIKQRRQYQLELEAAELQANPVAAEDLRLIAERLARKAQSGFGGPDNDSATPLMKISR